MCSIPGNLWPPYRGGHGRMRPIRLIHQAKDSIMSQPTKKDPRLGDVLSKTAGRVVRRTGPTGKVAYAARRTESTIRNWRGGAHANLINRMAGVLDRLVRVGANPELILAFLEGAVFRVRFEKLTDTGLVDLWWKTHPEESRLEGEENEVWASFPITGDLDAGIDADIAEIAIQKRRLGCSLECQRRGIDPRVALVAGSAR